MLYIQNNNSLRRFFMKKAPHLSRQDQMFIFFHFFFHFKDSIGRYEGQPSFEFLKQFQTLKRNIKAFLEEHLMELEEDIYDGLMHLQEYISNYMHHKKHAIKN